MKINNWIIIIIDFIVIFYYWIWDTAFMNKRIRDLSLLEWEEFMTEILKDAIMIVSGIVGGYLFLKIREKIVNKTKEVAEEKFNLPKFTSGMLNVISPVGWAKDIASIFNLRKLIIVGVIIGIIFGYGYWKGQQGKEVHFDLKGKAAVIQLNEHFLKIEKDGTAKVIDKDGKILKTIKVKDIDGLRQLLRPYGFQIKPFVTAGGSIGSKTTGVEGGAGIDFFKWFKSNLNAFATNRGIYLGIGYRITDNFDILSGIGKGYEEDTRVYIGGKWKF